MKSLLKRLIQFAALLCVAPALVLFWIGALALPKEKAFAGWSQFFSLIPGLTGNYLRWAFYRWVLAECGPDACICFGTVIAHPGARIGPRVYVGPYCALGAVTLEEDVLLGAHVSVMNGCRQHGIERLDVPIREQPGHWLAVTVGQGSWIGERGIVSADVGRHCVLGAGSVVVKPIPDYAVAVGNPARVIRSRSEFSASDPPTAESSDRRANGVVANKNSFRT